MKEKKKLTVDTRGRLVHPKRKGKTPYLTRSLPLSEEKKGKEHRRLSIPRERKRLVSFLKGRKKKETKSAPGQWKKKDFLTGVQAEVSRLENPPAVPGI